jgi:hypothetical protein
VQVAIVMSCSFHLHSLIGLSPQIVALHVERYRRHSLARACTRSDDSVIMSRCKRSFGKMLPHGHSYTQSTPAAKRHYPMLHVVEKVFSAWRKLHELPPLDISNLFCLSAILQTTLTPPCSQSLD